MLELSMMTLIHLVHICDMDLQAISQSALARICASSARTTANYWQAAINAWVTVELMPK